MAQEEWISRSTKMESVNQHVCLGVDYIYSAAMRRYTIAVQYALLC